ncbi:MAG: hypothetical protein H5U32_03445 [Pseudomonas balearica]|uniref:hypothetical protein n=1 Tax=Stutzerimonas balearica TaxID=74829 RepID=UPI001991A8D2|nr:hypothetical protein [Stutzerimonas balearica]MBC7198284.1 hypothetical protein [Stutzerimonas balearica]
MTSLTQQMNTIQSYGTQVGSAVRQSQKLIEDNQFLLSADNGKMAKYVFWAAAGAGLVAGLAAVPALPVIGAIAVGVSAGVGVVGSALERIATEREQVRNEHAQFVSQARGFMKELQTAYSETKHALQEAHRQGTAVSADFAQYQAQREQQKLAQEQANAMSQDAPKPEQSQSTKSTSGFSLS